MPDLKFFNINNNNKNNKSKNPRKMLKSKPIIIAAIIIVIISFIILKSINSNNKSVNLENDVIVTIPEGASTKKISEILKEKGVVKSAKAFKSKVKSAHADATLKPGDYKFAAGEVELDDVIKKIKNGEQEIAKITIPEGLTVKQTAKLLAKKQVISEKEFLACAANCDFSKYDFIADTKKSERLEGYLFPSTYELKSSWQSQDIINILLKQFDNVFKDEWKQRAQELDMSLNEVITLASLIEREAKIPEDRALISSVFHNRLKSGQRLESCATIQYLLGENKTRLTQKDLSIKSPYNTYLNKGLPPGPIASPGADCIEAALYPEDTDYYYFLAKNDGSHYFSKTFKEHSAAKKKYIDNNK